MKNDANDSLFDLLVVPPFPKFKENKFNQIETNLTPVNVHHQHLSLEMIVQSQ